MARRERKTLMPHNKHTVYAITDATLMPTTASLCHRVELALRSGVTWLQYRDKSSNTSKRSEQAQALKALCQTYNAKLIINDDTALAKQVGADGVHLGQTDGCIVSARELLGPQAIIGSTCHASLELAERALAQGSSYVAFGRFFASNTKPNAAPAQLSLLAHAQQKFTCPIVAIGGITPSNGAQLLHAGATTLAVCHSLFADDNVEYRAKCLLGLTPNAEDALVTS